MVIKARMNEKHATEADIEAAIVSAHLPITKNDWATNAIIAPKIANAIFTTIILHFFDKLQTLVDF